ncbi:MULTISPECIES: SRPBCC family protein [Priestia]|uniref:SRPBCC family protein n=1 Tax=Priestia TaxID=2800373 RepID=UPI000D3E672E|nr:SRPBCC family protein [Priestia megaterium]AWD68591.1 polyketide cyclase [Priestia megaterium]MED4030245.1 SRPBCC family protein [Priestia megaterium]
MGYTKNSIHIKQDFDTVFDKTNDINNWTNLFTEYQESKVLKREKNEILFQLSTFPEKNKPSRTWISRRIIDKENKEATAERLDPKFPFKFMHIHWTYNIISDNEVEMTWVQKFQVDSKCPLSEEEMETFLNENTKVQMKSIKSKLEQLSTKSI